MQVNLIATKTAMEPKMGVTEVALSVVGVLEVTLGAVGVLEAALGAVGVVKDVTTLGRVGVLEDTGSVVGVLEIALTTSRRKAETLAPVLDPVGAVVVPGVTKNL